MLSQLQLKYYSLVTKKTKRMDFIIRINSFSPLIAYQYSFMDNNDFNAPEKVYN